MFRYNLQLKNDVPAQSIWEDNRIKHVKPLLLWAFIFFDKYCDP